MHQQPFDSKDHADSFNNKLAAALLEKGNLKGILDGNNISKEVIDNAMENFVYQIKTAIQGNQE